MAVSSSITVPASAVACDFRFSGEDEHLLDVRAVFGEQFLRLVVGLQVVVAVGKAQSALIDLGDDHGGVVVVLLPGEAEERGIALVVSELPGAGIEMVQVRDSRA